MGRNIDQCPSMLCVMMPAANDNGVETVMMAKLFTPLILMGLVVEHLGGGRVSNIFYNLLLFFRSWEGGY